MIIAVRKLKITQPYLFPTLLLHLLQPDRNVYVTVRYESPMSPLYIEMIVKRLVRLALTTIAQLHDIEAIHLSICLKFLSRFSPSPSSRGDLRRQQLATDAGSTGSGAKDHTVTLNARYRTNALRNHRADTRCNWPTSGGSRGSH